MRSRDRYEPMRPNIGVCWPLNARNICFNFNVVFHFGESWWVYPSDLGRCLGCGVALDNIWCCIDIRVRLVKRIMSVKLVKHTGGCHCGKVRFEVLAKAELRAYDCK